EAFEAFGEAVGIERRRRHHEARHAEILQPPDAVDVGSRASRGHLDRGGVPSDPGALLAHDLEQVDELLLLGDAREEAVAVAGGASGGELGMATDDDRDAWLLDRLRVRLERPPAEELARERLRLRLPQRAHAPDRLRGA